MKSRRPKYLDSKLLIPETHKLNIKITEETIVTAKNLRDKGYSWRSIGLLLCHNSDAIRRHLDPEYKKKRIELNKKYRAQIKKPTPEQNRKRVTEYRRRRKMLFDNNVLIEKEPDVLRSELQKENKQEKKT